MALFRGIQQYIALDAIIGQYILVSPSRPSNIIIHIGLSVSSYYLTIVSDCRLPFCLFTNRALFRSHIIAGNNNINALLVTKPGQ